MSGFDEYIGHASLRSFNRTIRLAALFVAAMAVGAGVAWVVS